jgi:hypothetical protein
MPASTLPTRSPPTSAPLVKMPPPRRAKIDDGEAEPAVQEAEVERDAEQREAGHQHAGDRARLERELEAAGERADRGLGGAHVGAHRDVHADEARDAGEHGADREAERHQPAEEIADHQEDHDTDDADRGVLALEIGLRALAHGGGNLLHARAAGIGGEHRANRPDRVEDRERPAGDDQPQSIHGSPRLSWKTGR